MFVSLYHVRFLLVRLSLVRVTTISSSAPTTRDRLQVGIGQLDECSLATSTAIGLFSPAWRSRLLSARRCLPLFGLLGYVCLLVLVLFASFGKPSIPELLGSTGTLCSPVGLSLVNLAA